MLLLDFLENDWKALKNWPQYRTTNVAPSPWFSVSLSRKVDWRAGVLGSPGSTPIWEGSVTLSLCSQRIFPEWGPKF